jgi:hypothetical protein
MEISKQVTLDTKLEKDTASVGQTQEVFSVLKELKTFILQGGLDSPCKSL